MTINTHSNVFPDTLVTFQQHYYFCRVDQNVTGLNAFLLQMFLCKNRGVDRL